MKIGYEFFDNKECFVLPTLSFLLLSHQIGCSDFEPLAKEGQGVVRLYIIMYMYSLCV